MNRAERWDERYRTGTLPWDRKAPDANLVDIVKSYPIPGGKALEIGCGTGTHAIWLAENGFEVTALDIAPTAVEMAGEKAQKAGVEIDFQVADFLAKGADIDGGPFDFIFDRGVFHSRFVGKRKRELFARRVSSHLRDNGLWLSLVGCKDYDNPLSNMPRRSATEVVIPVEKYFKIISLTTGSLNPEDPETKDAWIGLYRKR